MQSQVILARQTTIHQPVAIRINETHFLLKEDYVYYWTVDGKDAGPVESMGRHVAPKIIVHNWIVVKAGFRWDGASVPGFLRKFGFATDGSHRAAALIHDFVYVHEGELPVGSMISEIGDSGIYQSQSGSFSREDADRLFGKMMKQGGVNKRKRLFMKWGVSSFGWIFWQDGPDLKRKLFWNCVSYLLLVFVTCLAMMNVLDDTAIVIVGFVIGLLTTFMLLKTLRVF